MKYLNLFPQKFRSFKLIRNKDIENKNIFFNNKKILFVPIAETIEEISFFVKQLFGSNGYKSIIKQYFFPTKIVFRKTVVQGPMVQSKIDINKYSKKVSTKLSFSDTPRTKINSIKNVIIDYTKPISYLLPKNNEMVMKMIQKKYLHKIIPEFITYFFLGDEKLDLLGINHSKGMNIMSNNKYNRDFLEHGFERVVFAYRIKATDKSLFTRSFISGNSVLPTDKMRNVENSYDFFLIKFIIEAYSNNKITSENESYNQWLEMFREKNPVFYFYNNEMSFVVDIHECLHKRKIKIENFIKYFLDNINIMIMRNSGSIPDEDLNNMFDKLEANDEQMNIPQDEKEDSTGINNMINNVFNNLVKFKEKPIVNNVTSKLKEIMIDDANMMNKKEFMGYTKSESNFFSNLGLQKETKSLFQDNKRLLNNIDDSLDEDHDIEEDINDIEDEDLSEDVVVDKDTNIEEDEEIIEDVPDNLDSKTDDDDVEKNVTIDEEAEVELLSEEEEKILKSNMIIKETTPQQKKTPKQLKRIEMVKNKYKSVQVRNGKSIDDIINDKKANIIDHNVKDVDIKDKSLIHNNVLDFENSYINKTYEKDILNVIKSFSNEDKMLPLHIINYEKIDSSTQFTYKDTIRVTFEDEFQNRHVMKFDIPRPDENGRLKINGNYKLLKKQLLLLPVVKVKPFQVLVTTQFNKTMISRVGVNINKTTNLVNKLIVGMIDLPSVVVKTGNCVVKNTRFLSTIEYDFLAIKYVKIDIHNRIPNKRKLIMFNQEELLKMIIDEFPHYKIDDNKLPIGIDFETRKVIEIDLKNENDSCSKKILDMIVGSGVIKDVTSVIKSIKPPNKRMHSIIYLQSKKIPLIIFLSAIFGFKKVLHTYNVKYQLSDKLLRDDPRPYIHFKDYYFYYDEYPMNTSLLFNGLTEMDTKNIKYSDLEIPDPYLNYLKVKQKNTNIYKGWVSFKELFIDPITKEILIDLELPTDTLELLLYCNDLLGDNEFKPETDMSNYRIRGYEMMAEALYKSMCDQYTLMKQKRNPSKTKFTIPQDSVMTRLNGYPLFANCDITNPINELKEKGIVSFKGLSGVNIQEAFTLQKRSYHSSMVGIIAMSTVDNNNVAIIKELSMNANISSTRGYVIPCEDPKRAKELSTSQVAAIQEALSPFGLKHDSPNRTGFYSNQTVHTIPISHADACPVRTGLEKSLIYHSTNSFADKASQDGEVIDVDETEKLIKIQYKDGTRKIYNYGKRIHRNSNYFIESTLECNVKKGQKIKKDDVLTYDNKFYQKDGNEFTYKFATRALVGIFEADYTDDDSCLITEQLSRRLSTPVIARKQISFSPETNIINALKIGDKVHTGDSLMVFEDVKGDGNLGMMLKNLDDLDGLNKEDYVYHSPKSSSNGTIIDVKVYWTVPIEEFSESCQAFIKNYLKKEKKKAAADNSFTGNVKKYDYNLDVSVPHLNRINGKELPPDSRGIVIEYFIEKNSGVSVGDKVSILSALKTIVGFVVPDETSPYRILPNGQREVIDMITSFSGIQKRGTVSVYIYGAMAKVLSDYGEQVAREYLSSEK